MALDTAEKSRPDRIPCCGAISRLWLERFDVALQVLGLLQWFASLPVDTEYFVAPG